MNNFPERSGHHVSVTWYGQAGFRLVADVLMLPINGRDHMREARGIVGNMNETEAAWLCSQVAPSYVIPMHYEAIATNTGDPGHFTSLVHDSAAATVLVPPRATPITLTLP